MAGRGLHPTRPGDVLHLVTTVTAVTPSRSKPDRGIVTLDCRTYDQLEEPRLQLTVKILVLRRDQEPS